MRKFIADFLYWKRRGFSWRRAYEMARVTL